MAGPPSASTPRARRGSADTWARESRSSARARSASAGRSRSAGEDFDVRAARSRRAAARLGRCTTSPRGSPYLESFDLLDEPPDTILARVAALVRDLGAAVAGADHVQECAPETVELKRRLLGELDALTPPETILASSSSAITASAMASELPGRARCLVVHPGNPPYLLPVVEVVPAPTPPRTSSSGRTRCSSAPGSPLCRCASSSRASGSTGCRARRCARPTRSCATESAGRRHRSDRQRRSGQALERDRAVRDRRPQRARRHRRTRAAHGPGVRAHGSGARRPLDVDGRARRPGRRRAPGPRRHSTAGTSGWSGATGRSCGSHRPARRSIRSRRLGPVPQAPIVTRSSSRASAMRPRQADARVDGDAADRQRLDRVQVELGDLGQIVRKLRQPQQQIDERRLVGRRMHRGSRERARPPCPP